MGKIAVVGPLRNAQHGMPASFYLEALDGQTGRLLSRWPINCEHGLSLSADGRFVAVGDQGPGKNGLLAARAKIFSVVSGGEVATVTHDDEVRSPVNNGMVGGTSVSPDGRFFFTSANNKVKIWEISS